MFIALWLLKVEYYSITIYIILLIITYTITLIHLFYAYSWTGYGKSRNTLEDEYNAAFLRSLIQTLELDRPVIVSPSMSGRFSLPFIFEDGDMSMERVLAYIPVAPVGTSQFVQEFKKSQVLGLGYFRLIYWIIWIICRIYINCLLLMIFWKTFQFVFFRIFSSFVIMDICPS